MGTFKRARWVKNMKTIKWVMINLSNSLVKSIYMTLILSFVSIIFTCTYVSRFLIPWNYFLIKSYYSMTVMKKITLKFWKTTQITISISTIIASSVLMIVSEEMASHSLDLPLVWVPPLTYCNPDIGRSENCGRWWNLVKRSNSYSQWMNFSWFFAPCPYSPTILDPPKHGVA